MRGRQADIKFRHPCYIRHFLAVSGMKIRGSLRVWGGVVCIGMLQVEVS